MAAADTNHATDDDDRVESGTASSLPTAVVVPKGDTAPPDPARWIRRIAFLVALAFGWIFILFVNRFTFSAPSVFLCLAYLAIVSTAYALWRTGIVAVTEDAEEADSTWGRPLGRRSELEREKKTLLKAIKEAEFDREMGKLSKADAEEMIAVYRVRAIEVIKEIDQMDAGAAGSVREQIERELKARLELDAKTEKAKAAAVGDADKEKKKRDAHRKSAKSPEKESEHVFSKPARTDEPAPDATSSKEESSSKEATS